MVSERSDGDSTNNKSPQREAPLWMTLCAPTVNDTLAPPALRELLIGISGGFEVAVSCDLWPRQRRTQPRRKIWNTDWPPMIAAITRMVRASTPPPVCYLRNHSTGLRAPASRGSLAPPRASIRRRENQQRRTTGRPITQRGKTTQAEVLRYHMSVPAECRSGRCQGTPRAGHVQRLVPGLRIACAAFGSSLASLPSRVESRNPGFTEIRATSGKFQNPSKKVRFCLPTRPKGQILDQKVRFLSIGSRAGFALSCAGNWG